MSPRCCHSWHEGGSCQIFLDIRPHLYRLKISKEEISNNEILAQCCTWKLSHLRLLEVDESPAPATSTRPEGHLENNRDPEDEVARLRTKLRTGYAVFNFELSKSFVEEVLALAISVQDYGYITI